MSAEKFRIEKMLETRNKAISLYKTVGQLFKEMMSLYSSQSEKTSQRSDEEALAELQQLNLKLVSWIDKLKMTILEKNYYETSSLGAFQGHIYDPKEEPIPTYPTPQPQPQKTLYPGVQPPAQPPAESQDPLQYFTNAMVKEASGVHSDPTPESNLEAQEMAAKFAGVSPELLEQLSSGDSAIGKIFASMQASGQSFDIMHIIKELKKANIDLKSLMKMAQGGKDKMDLNVILGMLNNSAPAPAPAPASPSPSSIPNNIPIEEAEIIPNPSPNTSNVGE